MLFQNPCEILCDLGMVLRQNQRWSCLVLGDASFSAGESARTRGGTYGRFSLESEPITNPPHPNPYLCIPSEYPDVLI